MDMFLWYIHKDKQDFTADSTAQDADASACVFVIFIRNSLSKKKKKYNYHSCRSIATFYKHELWYRNFPKNKRLQRLNFVKSRYLFAM